MKNVDVELIQRVLNGDDTAFSALVKKYQKSVHALAWRKIGDFHIAEDITQDTFLKAYQELSTLKEPQSFASWLYVIAANRCTAWLRKKRLWTQSLENTNSAELEKATYSNYVITENERAAADAQREVVKKLLAKLQESDRTVITLYYLGGMTYEEISKFLGVSVSAIKNRLYRARQHLKKEEPMIREALENFQITPHLTENIMQEISRIKPATPTGGKPLVPWTIAASSAILIVLMLGIGSQYLVRFQQPYSLDAQTEMTVELVDAPVVLNLDAEPEVRRQFGNLNALGENDNNGQKPDAVLLAAAQAEGEDEISVPKQQWIQSERTIGSRVEGLFATSEGVLYTVHDAHIYKWQDDKTGWQQVSGDIRDYHDRLTKVNELTKVPIAKWDNTLYIVLKNLLLASKDDGKTWKLVHSWAGYHGPPKELVLAEQAFWVIFYNRAFRSEDKGKTWKDVDNELPADFKSLVAIQNTVFAASGTGLYRWNTDSWQRLEFPVPEAIGVISAASTKDRLYVMVMLGPDFNPQAAREGRQRTWWIFRSTDLGNSWTDITPTNAWPVKGWPPDIELVAAGEILLVMGRGMVRSADGGDTWMPPQDPSTLSMKIWGYLPYAALNERVFYVHTRKGFHRSTDGGRSWDKVNFTQDKRRLGLESLIVHKGSEKMHNMLPTLYGIAGRDIVKTTNKGKSWKAIQVEIPMTAPTREDPPWIIQIITSDGVIYAKGRTHYPIGELPYLRVSEDGKTLEPIQGIPTFDSRELREHLRKSQNLSIKELQEGFSGATLFFKQLLQTTPQQQDRFIQRGLEGPFAVSDDTFYMEYNFKLFRWESGDTEWQDIRQEETSEITRYNLKLAVSGDTVYVGKRDGHLVVSFDRGNNWIDLTPALPFPVKNYKQILVSGSTVYVATNAGILTSDDGRNWRVVTDAEGTNLIMEQLAVDGTTVYGITQKTGIYRLGGDSGTWEQIITEIPESATMNIANEVTSLAVAGNTLYVGSLSYGMLHFNLEE